jgi:WD40 repeat protein
MPRTLPLSLLVVVAVGSLSPAADEKAKPKVNFQDNVAAIFQTRCNSCHNADKAKGGLSLDTYAAAMQGGSSGAVIEPGDANGSHLWGVVSHAEEPKMPPNGPKIPDAELAAIKAWIEAGAPETSGSVVAMKAKPKFEFKLDPSSMGKPVGPPAMPEGVSTEPVVVSPKANAIVAMAASPWAPLVAVAGHKQVLLYEARKSRLVGVLPFPEGTVYTLKFSRNGSLLLAGGGRGGQSGLAVVFDVKTGKRVFEIGKEYDVVLAADISPDHGQVALGGPSKVVRVYNTADGSLQFEMKKHTEWVTAMEFSPDGVLLATGDRNNGLVVWEAQTGREFFDLRGHSASITDVSWRLDSNVVASAAEDGSIRLWEMEGGNAIKAWGAHGGGVASARFAKDGRIVTTGRDRVVRVWGQDGGKQKEFEPFGDLALRAVFADDDSKVVAGDWSGEVRVIDGKEGKRLANLLANPAPIATRLEQTKVLAQQARLAADQAVKTLAPLELAVQDRTSLAAKAQQALDEAQKDAQSRLEAVAAAEKVEADRAKLLLAATDALKSAQAIAEKAQAEKARLEKAVAETALAEKSAAEAIPRSRAALEKAFADKSAQDQELASAVEALKSAADPATADQAGATLAKALARSAELAGVLASASKVQVESIAAHAKASAEKAEAPTLFAAGSDRARLALEAVPPAQLAVDQATSSRAEATQQLAAAREMAGKSKALADIRKNERDASIAAKSAAEKALADQRPAVDALVARANDLQSEVDALLAELKASQATRTASNRGS